MKILRAFLIIFLVGCSSYSNDINLAYRPANIEIFAEGLISTGMYERDIAISPDGREIVYTISNYKQNKRCLIGLIKKEDTWSERRLMDFSGRYQDIEPFFTPDGKKLFFVSNRPVTNDSTRKDYNIWYVSSTENGWKTPIPLNEKINTTGNEFYPSVGNSGTLYFTATRNDGIGKEDIFMSKFINGDYQDPIPLDSGLNSVVYEFNAFVNPDENLIIFGSYGRPDEFGGGDLYYSLKNDQGIWTTAKNLGETINSSGLDYCPFIDYARGNFYFTSDRVSESDVQFSTVEQFILESNGTLNGMGNIYRVALDQLDLK